MRRCLSRLAPVWLTGMLAAGAVAAQGLPDPTRPPAALDVAGATDPAAGQAGLQTIIRRAGAKPAAVIAGHYVELGGKVGEARLVKVGEDRVELRGAAGVEVLFLTPTVEKKMPVPAAPTKGRKGARAETRDGARR